MASVLRAGDLRAALLASLDDLREARGAIDAANVYPVPDADTGTNLVMTFEAVARALAEAGNDEADIAGAISAGALKGARGNSGIIMAQVLRAWAEGVAEGPAKPKEVARSFLRARDLAYEAVLEPAEGTILSVLSAAAAAAGAKHRRVDRQFAAAVEAAATALAHTPDQMAVLARSGVVDAGGMGLLTVLSAVARTLGADTAPYVPHRNGKGNAALRCAADEGIGPFRYEVMYMLAAPGERIPALRELLGAIGDSVAVIGGVGTWRVHVHTDDPLRAREIGASVGEVSEVDQVDFREQTAAPAAGSRGIALAAPATDVAVIAVAASPGVRRLFEGLGAHVVDEADTARTAEALVRAVGEAGGPVVVLPNDEEIFARARLALESDDRVTVLRTADAAQGLSVAVAYVASRDAEENVREMRAALDRVRSGQVTIAPVAFETDAGPAEPGDAVGFVEGAAVAVGADPVEVAGMVAEAMASTGAEIVTILAGADVPDEERDGVAERVRAAVPGAEVEVHDAGIPRHRYVLAAE